MFIKIRIRSDRINLYGFVFRNIVSRTLQLLSVPVETLEDNKASFSYKENFIVIELKTQKEGSNKLEIEVSYSRGYNKLWDNVRALHISTKGVSSGFPEVNLHLYLQRGAKNRLAHDVMTDRVFGHQRDEDFSCFLPDELRDLYVSYCREDAALPFCLAIFSYEFRFVTWWSSGELEHLNEILKVSKFMILLSSKYIELVEDEESSTSRELTFASQQFGSLDIVVVVLEHDFLDRETWSKRVRDLIPPSSQVFDFSTEKGRTVDFSPLYNIWEGPPGYC